VPSSQNLDLEALLAPIPGENPAGRSLRYEGTYDAIQEARRADDDLPQGPWQRARKVADWAGVIQLASEALSTKSKDLQIAAWLVEALVKQHGFSGLRDGLRLLWELNEGFWASLYPESEDGDFEFRVNILKWTNEKLPPSIRAVSITDSDSGENYSWLHWEESRRVDTLGRLNQEAMEAALADGKITGERFERAAAVTSIAFYQALYEDLNQSRAEYNHLTQVLNERFGRQAPSFLSIAKAMEDCCALVESIVKKIREQSPRIGARKRAEDTNPPGFKLRHTLQGDNGWIGRIAWSPDGRMLASPSSDHTIRLWDVQAGQLRRAIRGHSDWVTGVAWSPDGRMLASSSRDQTIRLWDVATGELYWPQEGHTQWATSVTWSRDGQLLASASNDMTIHLWETKTGILRRTLQGHTDWVTSVAWSVDGRILASGSGDGTIRLWDVIAGLSQTLRGHSRRVTHIAWSPSGQILASASQDKTVRIWDPERGKEIHRLEGHVETVRCVSFAFDERLLASKSWDGTVRLWRCDTWEMVAVLAEEASPNWAASLAFHPHAPVLATLGRDDSVIRIWDLDFTALLNHVSDTPSVHYTNAKVILVGDSGVGKTGLALVLTGQAFAPTESTHGRHVWALESREVALRDSRKEMRETLLWDLAGQPGYRLVHQLHLNEVAVALVVFDARSETDPFSAVRYWDHALRQVQRADGRAVPLMKKFLVAARIDRGSIGVSRTRRDSLIRDLEFDEAFETSAKEGWNIALLADAIRGAIAWEALPKVSSTEIFQCIKVFLVEEKRAGRLLSTTDDLHRAFLRSGRISVETDNLRAEFDTCIGLVESRGLIRRLSFGNLVLMQPELLDAYASAMLNAARDEPDGMGSIAEEEARTGRFRMSEDERIKDKAQENLLLIATVEDLLRHEIALREQADEGPYLIFPSQLTRERPDLPDPEGKTVIFGFEGPVLNIYATLAVRLSHSGIFTKEEMWKNAIIYTARVGGTCGMFFSEVEEGRGELTLFFNTAASEETRFQFEEYIRTHLLRRALQESIYRRRMFTCPDPLCGEPITDNQAKRRRERGYTSINCPVCGTEISLLDREELLAAVRPSIVLEMDRAADSEREHETAVSRLQGKIVTGDFDVFLCHNSADKPQVREIAEWLKKRGLLPWLDEWELRPGLPWQRLLEQQITQIKAAAVFVGREGVGPWQQQELDAFLREFVDRGCPVIPILLPDAPREPHLPIFLKGYTWVDFRQREPDPIERLIWGVTGERA
jgi:type VI secretion system ImpA family protein